MHHGSGTAVQAAVWGSLRLNRSPLVRTLLACAAICVAVALSGCNTDGVLPMSEKAARPLPQNSSRRSSPRTWTRNSPILIRVFKEESELEVWKQDRTGRFALLKTYPICRWSGELGPKIKEGDRQAPEGFYTITPGQMNPNSAVLPVVRSRLSERLDRAHGRTGAQLMVHGDCSSRGCYSMTDEQISEIYALGRDSFFGGQKSFQVQAYPFRMTPQNLAKHRNSPHLAFWKMLKKGNDHFEVTRLEPKRQCLREALRVRRAVAGRSVAAAVVQRAGQVPRLRGGRRDRHRRADRSSSATRPGSPIWSAATSRPRRSRPTPTAACIRCSSPR